MDEWNEKDWNKEDKFKNDPGWLREFQKELYRRGNLKLTEE